MSFLASDITIPTWPPRLVKNLKCINNFALTYNSCTLYLAYRTKFNFMRSFSNLHYIKGHISNFLIIDFNYWLQLSFIMWWLSPNYNITVNGILFGYYHLLEGAKYNFILYYVLFLSFIISCFNIDNDPIAIETFVYC